MFLLMSFIFTGHLFFFFFLFFMSKCMSNSAAEVVRSHHNCAAVELAHGKHSGLLIHYLSAWKIVHHSLDSFVMLNIAFCGTVFGATFPLSVP